MVRWSLISGPDTKARAAHVRAVVTGLRARGLKVGGFFQESQYEDGQRTGSTLIRLAAQEQARVARTGNAPTATEESFCSMLFDEDVFARARAWLADDLAWADVVVLGDISKLEGGGRGHAIALERALKSATRIVLSVRPDQLFAVVERFGLPEPAAALDEPFGPSEIAKVVEAIAGPRDPQGLMAGMVHWDQRWQEMARARRREDRPPDPWAKRAKRFARHAQEGNQAWLFDVLGPLLEPTDSVLEIGAGTGRHVVELARRTRWVRAIEPSLAMRAELERTLAEARVTNVEIVAEAWPLASGLARAEVAFSCHVLYAVEDAAAFLRAMTECARRLCVLVLAPRPPMSALEGLEVALLGQARPRAPGALEAFALLWQLGYPASLQLLPASGGALRFCTQEEDLRELCHRLDLDDGPEERQRVRAALLKIGRLVEDGVYELGTHGPHALITWPGAASG